MTTCAHRVCHSHHCICRTHTRTHSLSTGRAQLEHKGFRFTCAITSELTRGAAQLQQSNGEATRQLRVTRHTSHVTRHTSHVTPHTSPAQHHTSHVTSHTSHATKISRTHTHAHARTHAHASLLVLLLYRLHQVAPQEPAARFSRGARTAHTRPQRL